MENNISALANLYRAKGLHELADTLDHHAAQVENNGTVLPSGIEVAIALGLVKKSIEFKIGKSEQFFEIELGQAQVIAELVKRARWTNKLTQKALAAEWKTALGNFQPLEEGNFTAANDLAIEKIAKLVGLESTELLPFADAVALERKKITRELEHEIIFVDSSSPNSGVYEERFRIADGSGNLFGDEEWSFTAGKIGRFTFENFNSMRLFGAKSNDTNLFRDMHYLATYAILPHQMLFERKGIDPFDKQLHKVTRI